MSLFYLDAPLEKLEINQIFLANQKSIIGSWIVSRQKSINFALPIQVLDFEFLVLN